MKTNRTVEGIVHYCEANDCKNNCRGLALLLASLLPINSINVANITSMPYEDPFDNCNCFYKKNCHNLRL